MEKPIRIFWYCEKWQPGGIQAVQTNLLGHMDTQRLHFDIVSSEADTEIFDERISSAGARRLVSLSREYDGAGERTLANIFALRKMIRDGHYDVVHFNACHGVELVYMFWAWLYRVPVRIAHCRNNDIGAGGRMRPVKILCHRLCKHLFGACANVRLANSDLAAAWLYTAADLRKGNVQILKNGIDAKKYAFDPAKRAEVRARYGLDGRFVVGHVGHFSYQKNHEFLLHVFAEVAKREQDAVLLLIGAGDGEESVRGQVQQLGLTQRVVFAGVTDDVPAMMCAMDVFVLPSRFEGFGNVLIEAQASGLPCFASAGVIPQAAKVCENLQWISLDAGADQWAKEIAERGSGCERRSRVQDVAEAGFTIEAMAAELEKIYTTRILG